MSKRLIINLSLIFLILFGFSLKVFSGDWFTIRGNEQRTARVVGISDITSPTISWRYYLGGNLRFYETYVGDINQDGNKDILMLIGGKPILKSPTGTILWDG